MPKQVRRDALLYNIQRRMGELQELEKLVVMKKQEIVRDRQSLNDVQPVACLLDEILLIIFSFFIKGTSLANRDPFKGIVLTHTCSRWRNLAICSPTLWNEVNLLWPAWCKVLVERSRSTLLKVSCRCWDDDDTPNDLLTKYVFDRCSHRIKSFHLKMSRERYSSFSDELPDTLPALRILKYVIDQAWPKEPQLPVLPVFFNTLPEIEKLCLTRMQIAESHLLTSYSKLKFLSLCEMQTLALPDVIRLLNNTPHIQYLVLHDTILDQEAELGARPLQVILPNLLHLTMYQHLPTCISLLELLQAPSLISIHLFVMDFRSYQVNVLELLFDRVVNFIKSCPSFPPLTQMGLQYGDVSTILRAGEVVDIDPSVPTELEEVFKPSSQTFTPLVIDIGYDLSYLILTSSLKSTVRQLDIKLDDDMFELFCSPRLPSVDTLRLWDRSVLAIDTILKDDCPLLFSPQPLPNLRRLMIVSGPGTDDDEEVETLPNIIRETFNMRFVPSMRRFELSFIRCSYMPTAVLDALIQGVFTSFDNSHSLELDFKRRPKTYRDVWIWVGAEEQPVARRDFVFDEGWTKQARESSVTFIFSTSKVKRR